MFPQTLVEKIVQKYASDIPPNHEVRAGDYISISPYRVMTHDNTSAVVKKFVGFFSKGTSPKFFNPKQAGKIFSNIIQFLTVFTLDHNVQDKSPDNAKKYTQIEDFGKAHGVDFYPGSHISISL